MSASQLLLINQQKIMSGGTSPCNCTSQCAEKAASNKIHHARFGVSSRAASKIELGGQSTDTGCGWNVSAKPTFAPR